MFNAVEKWSLLGLFSAARPFATKRFGGLETA